MTVGLDIAKHDLQAALLDNDGRFRVHRFDQGEAGIQALRAWIKRHDALEAPIGLEATGIYSEPVAEALHGCGHRVSVINP
ncbi:MAG TPA: transposase, partial [Gammaproteobacteria bacterium]|nr:transposase [Gammaproteobacteria bacterium]